jgi:hypothetical protein
VIGSEPLQAPVAVQAVALVDDHVKVNGCPIKTSSELAEIATVGADVVTFPASFAISPTDMSKRASAAAATNVRRDLIDFLLLI